MRVMLRDAAARDGLQLRVFRRRVDDERRVKLFQNVAVLLEQQAEELPHVMAHNVHFERTSLSALSLARGSGRGWSQTG